MYLHPSTENKRNEHARIVETSKNGKLTHADVEKQTKHKNRYSKNCNELKHFAKNWTDLNGHLWTTKSILAIKLKEISNHVDTHEEDYKRAFIKLEYFGAFFQQKIHTGTQK